MQISRHWRLNAERYRLEGVRYETGEVSLQERPKKIERIITDPEKLKATRGNQGLANISEEVEKIA